MPILSKATYRLNVTHQSPMIYFRGIETVILQFIQNHKRPKIVKSFLGNSLITKLESSHFIISNYICITEKQKSKQYSTSILNRSTNQQDRLYSPEVNPCKYGQLIFYKNTKNSHGENIVSIINYIAKTRYLNRKDPFLTVIRN